VHGALALFRGLDDNEAFTPLDINEMLATLQSEFAEMSAKVSIEGRATRSILGKPQALRRCLTNLIANAVKFGSQATVVVEDGPALIIRVRDDGPGIPEAELERVFEPFYRLEYSRNRDTGGSGLGLSIARDVVQAHGGSLVLEGDKNWFGVGHNGAYTFDGKDYLIFHGYDAADKGRSKLRIEELQWDKDGWPVVVAAH